MWMSFIRKKKMDTWKQPLQDHDRQSAWTIGYWDRISLHKNTQTKTNREAMGNKYTNICT